MLASINFLMCFMAGLLCVHVLASKRINTMHPISMLFITFIGFAFITWMVDGMVRPSSVVLSMLCSRGFVLLAFCCWVAGRVQCEWDMPN